MVFRSDFFSSLSIFIVSLILSFLSFQSVAAQESDTLSAEESSATTVSANKPQTRPENVVKWHDVCLDPKEYKFLTSHDNKVRILPPEKYSCPKGSLPYLIFAFINEDVPCVLPNEESFCVAFSLSKQKTVGLNSNGCGKNFFSACYTQTIPLSKKKIP